MAESPNQAGVDQGSTAPGTSHGTSSGGGAQGNGNQQGNAKSGNAQAAAEPSSSKGGGKPLDVKSTFRGICGFCHEDYGRHAGKGPQLMNSQRSDEFITNRIKHGMPGRMPAFGGTFSDEQIQQIVKFIRNLKPNEEPQNPS